MIPVENIAITPSGPSKLTRLRNWQSHEFWVRLFARPLSILCLYPIADIPWVTPNLLTHVGNLFFAAAIAAMWLDHWIWAAVLLQIHLIFDNMDGTLARYRKCGTEFGSFYDKISDYFGTSAMFMTVGWLAYQQDTSRPHLILVGCLLAMSELIMGYSKWLTVALYLKKKGTRPGSVRSGEVPPPARTPAQWALWGVDSVARIVLFEEMDYFFWVGLALVMGRLDWVIYLLTTVRFFAMLGTVVVRGVEMRRLDAATE